LSKKVMKSILIFSWFAAALACTTVHIKTDETLVVGRTMELGNGQELLNR
jgi:penicillin V acylase-like amidase (Ntn superfamily)